MIFSWDTQTSACHGCSKKPVHHVVGLFGGIGYQRSLHIQQRILKDVGRLGVSRSWLPFFKWIFRYCTTKVENGTWKLRPIFFLCNYNHIMHGFRGKRSHWKTSVMILEEPNSMEKGACIVSIFFGSYIHANLVFLSLVLCLVMSKWATWSGLSTYQFSNGLVHLDWIIGDKAMTLKEVLWLIQYAAIDFCLGKVRCLKTVFFVHFFGVS